MVLGIDLDVLFFFDECRIDERILEMFVAAGPVVRAARAQGGRRARRNRFWVPTGYFRVYDIDTFKENNMEEILDPYQNFIPGGVPCQW